MKKGLLTTLMLLLIMSYSFGQTNWITTNSTRGNFNFLFPSQQSSKDTLGLVSYFSYLHDSTVSFQVNFIDSTAVYGNDEFQLFLSNRSQTSPNSSLSMGDPCYVDSIDIVFTQYAQMNQYFTQGTIEGYEPSDYSPCYIRGRQLVIRHPNQAGNVEGFYYSFTRYFYWNSKFLCFTVSGPEELLWDLHSYKDQIFNSIQIF
ncbi:MAG: hypothetical protein K2Q24_07265 [Chitinophagaceae bacterium]|jgi:hypothetical protein|nr:hypothetical protein [Chitinophagaceae bacterium]